MGSVSAEALERLRDSWLPVDLPRPGRPLVVEVGSGMGEATAACAAAAPDVDLLAVEVHTPGVAALLRRIEAHGLTNIRVVEADAVEVLQGLPPASVSEVRLWFPDPWPKARHAKRRFVQPATVDLVASRLLPGGRWHLATDRPEYVEHALPLLAGRFDAEVVERPSWRPVTRFESRGRTAGRPSYDVLAVLRPSESGRMGGRPLTRTRGASMSDTSRQNTTFPSGRGTAHGYLALPESGTGPGVLVIQEWWGLTDHIADITDRLAKEGFVALAPDLFGGKTAHDADEAGQLMMSLPVDQAAKDLGGAVDFLLAHEAVTSSKIGAVGFCMGGGFVLLLAAQQGDKVGAAVPFYGVGPAVPQSYAGLTAAVQGHYGLKDDFYPAEDAKKQQEQIAAESGAPVEFHFYEAGHAFHNDQDLLGTYSEGDAKTAWGRTVAFLHAQLG